MKEEEKEPEEQVPPPGFLVGLEVAEEWDRLCADAQRTIDWHEL